MGKYDTNRITEAGESGSTKTIYDAPEARRKATAKIAESGSGILSTQGEITRLNDILVPLGNELHLPFAPYICSPRQIGIRSGEKCYNLKAIIIGRNRNL